MIEYNFCNRLHKDKQKKNRQDEKKKIKLNFM